MCYGLKDDDIDLILLTEVRGRSRSAAFNGVYFEVSPVS